MASLPIMSEPEASPSLCNPQAEFDLLCVLLRDRTILETVADRVTQADFSDPFLGRMFGMLIHESAAGRHANALTIRPLLEKDPDFAAFGGWRAIADMTGTISLLYDWRGLASDLARFAKRRRLVTAFSKAIALAEDSSTAEDSMLEAADAAIAVATETQSSDRVIPASAALDHYIDTMNDPVPPGITCARVAALDHAMGPIRKTDLVIGAGRPGMGKTATALSYAIGAAQRGHGVLIVSLEMSADQLVERMLADASFDGRGGVPYELVRERRLDSLQRMEICRARETLRDLPIHIYDASSMTIPKLQRVVRRYKRKLSAIGQSLDLVIVDYLQLMSATTKSDNRVAHITEISNGLKHTAKSQNVGVFALSQLSREVEKRPDKRPQLSDLRESGSIEQDADVVVFFFRLEYYLRASEPDASSDQHEKWQKGLAAVEGMIDFICAKRRHGRSNITRQGRFHPEFQAVR
jgi:replicative DNA helicase